MTVHPSRAPPECRVSPRPALCRDRDRQRPCRRPTVKFVVTWNHPRLGTLTLKARIRPPLARRDPAAEPAISNPPPVATASLGGQCPGCGQWVFELDKEGYCHDCLT